MRGVGGDPIEAERVRRAARSRLFGEPEVPLRLGRFELGARIGAGGMGVVYAAHDPELTRTVAVKLLTEEGASLLDEARAMAAVRHPSLVVVHDVGTWEGRVFLAMERVDGPGLRDWLRTPRRTAEIVHVFAGAGRALAALHAAGFVHRDFKPDNVVIDADGRARLVDFGLARRAGVGGELAGTPAYLAPEVVRGAPPTAASDQYAFGVALAACDVPGRVRRIAARARAEDPADRWPSMTALVETLEHDPATKWRRGLAVAAVAGGLGVAVAVIVGPDADGPTCGDGGELLDGVWDDDRRAEVTAGFGATGIPYAAASATGVIAGLDAYAEEWRAARLDACQDTERKAQSADLLDRRISCLDRRLDALGATVDVLADPDADVVERAQTIAETVPAIDVCADAAVLRAAVPPPDELSTRDRLAELEPRRAGGVALATAARFDDAIAALADLVTEARVLAYAPFTAEALLALGAAQNTANRDGARAALFEAMTIAQASGHMRVVADATMLLAGGHIFRDEFSDARTWTELADASITAAGDDPRQRARWHGTMVQLTFNQGVLPDALDHAERAVAALVERGDQDTVAYGNALSNLGAVLGRIGRRDEALTWLTKALELRQRLLGPNHPEIANTLNSLAIIHEQLERYQDAADAYQRGYEIAVASTGGESLLAARFLDHQAGALRKLGKIDEAMAKRLEGLRIREAELPPDSTELAESYSNLGSLLASMGKFEDAEQRLQQALAIVTKAYGERHLEVANAWMQLAEVSLGRKDWDAALEREARAIEGFEAAIAKDCAELTYPLTGVGIAWMGKGTPHFAIEPLERAIRIAESSTAWPSELPRARFYLAQARLAVDDRVGARRAAEQARRDWHALGDADKVTEVDAWLRALGKPR